MHRLYAGPSWHWCTVRAREASEIGSSGTEFWAGAGLRRGGVQGRESGRWSPFSGRPDRGSARGAAPSSLLSGDSRGGFAQAATWPELPDTGRHLISPTSRCRPRPVAISTSGRTHQRAFIAAGSTWLAATTAAWRDGAVSSASQNRWPRLIAAAFSGAISTTSRCRNGTCRSAC